MTEPTNTPSAFCLCDFDSSFTGGLCDVCGLPDPIVGLSEQTPLATVTTGSRPTPTTSPQSGRQDGRAHGRDNGVRPAVVELRLTPLPAEHLAL